MGIGAAAPGSNDAWSSPTEVRDENREPSPGRPATRKMDTGVEILQPNASVLDRRDLGPELAVWTVRHDAEPVPDFEPGQFVQVGLPLERPAADETTRVLIVKRAYSIAS